REAFDHYTLKISNYKLSSGPYLLEKLDDSTITLIANKRHYHFNNSMPQKIAFLVSDRKSTELLEKGELDIITPDDYTTESQDLISFAKAKGYKLHKTFNIKSNILVFTDKGNSFLSSE